MKTITIQVDEQTIETLKSLTEYVENTLEGITEDVVHVDRLVALKDQIVERFEST